MRGPATSAADAVESETARKNLGVRITLRKESIIEFQPTDIAVTGGRRVVSF
jgi:hypothetical protein